MAQVPLSSGQLVEKIPGNTHRYDDTTPNPTTTTIIPSNQNSLREKTEVKMPDGWQCHFNPAEGRPYYWNPNRRIFTESNITEGHVLKRVTQWSQAITPLVDESTRSDYDIVLQVSENEQDEMGTCSYYLVDYNLEVVFWLRDIPNTTLGLPDVRSSTHLKLLLSEQFWTHCEYMPPPHKNLQQNARDLLATLGTLCIDASSSSGSVSPFSQDECESYSKSLTQVLSTGGPIEINWSLARLRSLLTQSRIINLFGESNARTDRNIVVNGQKAPPETVAFTLWSLIMFSIPSIYLARWNAIWVDRVTYTREWRKLTREMMEEFLYALIASGVMIIASILLLGLTSSVFVRTMATIATMLSILGGLYSASLFSSLRTLGGCAADAANFIQMNENINTGLQAMALKHSIPCTLIVWSGVCLFISVCWEFFGDMVSLLHPVIRVSGKDMIVPVLVVITYLYGRGYLSFTRL